MNTLAKTNPDHQKWIDGALAAPRWAKRRAEDLAIAAATELVEVDVDGNVVQLSPAAVIARRDRASAGKPGGCSFKIRHRAEPTRSVESGPTLSARPTRSGQLASSFGQGPELR